jgi:hypothetical protein
MYLYDRFIPISYNSGYVMFINNNDLNVNGMWMDPQRVVVDHPERAAILEAALYGHNIKQVHGIEPYFNSWAREWIAQNPGEYAKLGVLRVFSTFFDGANDIPQWAANVSPAQREGLSDSERLWYQRNHNFLISAADIITFVINGAGFLFLLAMFKKYALAVFTKKAAVNVLTAVIYINIAFFVVIAFMFEGQARYAFPVFIFMIPAAISLCAAINGYMADSPSGAAALAGSRAGRKHSMKKAKKPLR